MLSIRSWATAFENNRTRELKSLDWVPLPIRLDGDGYAELMDHQDGAAHFGVWIALIQVAARCDPRGTLVRLRRSEVREAHDYASLARLTRIDAGVMRVAINRLVDLGWLLDDDPESAIQSIDHRASQEGATIPQECATIPQEGALEYRRGEEITGDDRREENTPTPQAAGIPSSKPKREAKAKAGLADVPIPTALDFSEFREAWAKRLKMLSEKPSRDRPTPTSLAAQLDVCAQRPREAVALVLASLPSGWQGLKWKWYDDERARNNGRPSAGKAYSSKAEQHAEHMRSLRDFDDGSDARRVEVFDVES